MTDFVTVVVYIIHIHVFT